MQIEKLGKANKILYRIKELQKAIDAWESDDMRKSIGLRCSSFGVADDVVSLDDETSRAMCKLAAADLRPKLASLQAEFDAL